MNHFRLCSSEMVGNRSRFSLDDADFNTGIK
jgi:hypothetical protein